MYGERLNLLSYRHDGADRIGAVRGDRVVELTAATHCTDLGEALRKHGPDKLVALAAQSGAATPLVAIAYRPVVADPARILCVGLNYEEHWVEAGRARTAHPTLFLRLASSQTGHLQPIVLPPEVPNGLDYEGEIAIVIGRGRPPHPRRGRVVLRVRLLGLQRQLGARAACPCDAVHAGQELRGHRRLRPWLVTTDEMKPGSVLTPTTRLNG